MGVKNWGLELGGSIRGLNKGRGKIRGSKRGGLKIIDSN